MRLPPATLARIAVAYRPCWAFIRGQTPVTFSLLQPCSPSAPAAPPPSIVALYETWLAPNRRVLGLALVPALLLGGIGGLLWAQFLAWPVRLAGGFAVAASVVLIVSIILQMRRPRIAYHQGKVHFFLTSRRPHAVPVEIVEAFFIGQGPAGLPGASDRNTRAINLVARLSQRAPDWAERDVKQALGRWEEGYVSIRGTWCEPLTGEVVRRLNRRLSEVQRDSESAENSDDRARQ